VKIPGAKTVVKMTRWLQDRLLGGALILGYHRIAPAEGVENELCVAPSRFADQLNVLRKYANPISLTQLVQHLREGSLPPRSVALTFDDGYADNLYQARPLLEQHQFPATVFVSTGFLGGIFWWDELERLVLNSPIPLNGLRLKLQGSIFAGGLALLGEVPQEKNEKKTRGKYHQDLYSKLFRLSVEEREAVLEQVRAWAGSQSLSGAEPRALREDELRELAAGELIEIGAHSVSHPFLPCVTAEEQRAEILESKVFLEQLLGKPVVGFAYPNGKFTSETQVAVREAGFSFACASQQELCRRSAQLYALPRFWPKDWNEEQFLRHLRHWGGF
jgi:peptidoglycan/xylan/chitin deacetylase (PgdA/CDA1 family)